MSEQNKNILSRMRCNRGFTLVEMLAVIAIIVTVGTIILAIVTNSLSGSGKSDAISQIRQNGSYALAQMTRVITYSKSFSGVSSDGQNYANGCLVSQTDPTPTPVPYSSIRVTSFDGGVTTYTCEINGNADLDTISSTSATLQKASLLDVNNVTLTECHFTCEQVNLSDQPRIGIVFTLTSKKSPGTNSTFQTTVIPRNF